MPRPRYILVLFVMAGIAQAQVPPDKALATFTVHNPKLELSLWASEPLFSNPTCIDIDHRGRVWVCESVNYRHTLFGRPALRPEGDRILILEDTKGTGHADKVTTFYQAPDILAPLGIAVAKDPVGPGYKVFVCQSPNILVFEDKDGDGHADGPPRKLLTGFRGVDHDHGVHGILIGPDNKLYFSVGDQGVDGLRGKGDKKVWRSNDTDCQGGTIWRCELDGSDLELIAHNFRNEYEPCLDSFGTIFVSDNDDDGNQQTRICYVMPGGNYGYWPRGPHETHWHEEQPGVVPKILRTYFGSPTGMQVYEGTLLPKEYWGQPLHTDAGPRHVRCYHLTPKGASYAVKREDIVTSTDTWFRPSDICVAPDGSAYIADWYDPGVGGHGMGDRRRGRIYRLAPKGNRPRVPKVDLNSPAGLLEALASPARSVRYMAMAKFMNLKPDKALAVLLPATKQHTNVWLRARALWQIGRIAARWKMDRESNGDVSHAIGAVLLDPDARFQALGIRLIHEFFPEAPWAIVGRRENLLFISSLLQSRMPISTAREILLAARHAKPSPQVGEPIMRLARLYDGKDRFYLEAIGIAVGHLDQERRRILLAGFGHKFPKWDKKTTDLIWELQPPEMLPALEKRLADPVISAQQRSRAVELLAVYSDTRAGESLLRALQQKRPDAVRDEILMALQNNLRRRWSQLAGSTALRQATTNLLNQPSTRLTGLALISATRHAADIQPVTRIASDPKERTETRVAAVQTLGNLSSWQGGKVLQKLIAAHDTPLPVQQASVAALASQHDGAAWLLQAQKQQRLPQSLKPDVASLLRNNPYQDIRQQAVQIFPPPGRLDVHRMPSLAALAHRRGNIQHGRELFFNNKNVRCSSCHTVQGVGGHVGPELSVIGTKASRENLFESILWPSKAIADQYINWTITTQRGLVLNGLIVEETPDHIVLRDANGKDTRLSKSEIDERKKSPVSLMPGDLYSYLTEDDLVDLVEYLFSLKTPEHSNQSAAVGRK